MRTLPSVHAVLPGVVILLALASPLVAQQNDERPREQIGEVLGEPVYREEIRTGENVPLRDELHRLFTAPILQEYRRTHKAEITPTESEINTATAYFDKKHRERIEGKEPELRGQLKAIEEKLAHTGLTKEEKQKLEIERRTLQTQLKPPGRSFAVFMLRNWKFQRHLYDRYGGGRILWQQAGLEAFDAMHQWLEAEEKSGKFKINDPKLRSVFYEYWTTMKHGPFLTDNKERIRREFLEPEWLATSRSEN
jgi:hypothetical protein